MRQIIKSGVYKKNIKILKEKFPQQFVLVEKQSDIFSFDYHVVTSEDGLANVSVHLADNRDILLYEEGAIGDDINKKLLKQKLGKNDLLMCIGMGLGHIPNLAVEKFSAKPKIVIVERFVEMFKLALSLVDCRELLSYENLDIHLGPDFAVDTMLTQYREQHYSEICQRIVHAPSKQLFGEKFNILEKEITEQIRFMMSAWNTVRIHGNIILKNSLDNLASLFSSTVINHLKGKFKDLPAVCVASGPSLEKDLPVLKEIKDSVLILACDSAVKPLVDEGIIPHIVFAVDYLKMDFDKIRDSLDHLKDTILVYLMDANASTVQGFPGQRRMAILSKNPFLREWLLPEFGIDFGLPGIITSNSDAVVLTAMAAGASPIVLCGMDLAFSSGKDHTRGAMSISIKQVKEMVKTDGIGGFPVLSLPALVSGRLALENNIHQSAAEFIDASLDGALISGTRIKSLSEVRETIVKDHINIQSIIDKIDWGSPFHSEQIDTSLKNIDRIFNSITQKAVSILKDICRTIISCKTGQDTLVTTRNVKKLIRIYDGFIKRNRRYLRMIKNIRYDDQLDIDRKISNLYLSAQKSPDELNQETLTILKIYFRSVYLFARSTQQLIGKKKAYFKKVHELSRILANNPDELSVRLDLARCHAAENSIWLAQTHYEAYMKARPEDDMAVRELIGLMLENEMYKQAFDYVARLEAVTPRVNAVPELRQQIEAKSSRLLSLAAKNATDAENMTKETQGQTRRDLMAYLSVYPEDGQALDLLDKIQRKQQNQEKCMRDIICFSYSPEQVRYLKTTAENAVLKGDYERAVGIYEGFMGKFPDQAGTCCLDIGDARLAQKDHDSAAYQYAKSCQAGVAPKAYEMRMRYLNPLKAALHIGKHKAMTGQTVILPHTSDRNSLEKCISDVAAAMKGEGEIIVVSQDPNALTGLDLSSLEHSSKVVICTTDTEPDTAKSINQALTMARGTYITVWEIRLPVAPQYFEVLRDLFAADARPAFYWPRCISPAPSGINDEMPGAVFPPGRHFASICPTVHMQILREAGLLDEVFDADPIMWHDLARRVDLAGFDVRIIGNVQLLPNTEIAHHHAVAPERMEDKWIPDHIPWFIRKQFRYRLLFEEASKNASMGRLDRAVTDLVRSLESDPNEVRIYLALSQLLLDEEKYSDALAALNSIPEETMARLKASDKEALQSVYASYVAAYLGRNDTSRASEYLDRAFEISSESANCHYLKGLLYIQQNDRMNAEKAFQASIEKDPEYGPAWMYLGMLRWAEGQTVRGLKILEKAFQVSPTIPEVMTTYHQHALKAGTLDRAIVLFKSAVAAYPWYKRLYYLLVDLLLNNHDPSAAMALIEESMALFGTEDGILESALAIRNQLRPMGTQTDRNNEHVQPVSAELHIRSEINGIEKYLFQLKKRVDEINVQHDGNAPKSARVAMVFGAKIANKAAGHPDGAIRDRFVRVVDHDHIQKWVDRNSDTKHQPPLFP